MLKDEAPHSDIDAEVPRYPRVLPSAPEVPNRSYTDYRVAAEARSVTNDYETVEASGHRDKRTVGTGWFLLYFKILLHTDFFYYWFLHILSPGATTCFEVCRVDRQVLFTPKILLYCSVLICTVDLIIIKHDDVFESLRS